MEVSERVNRGGDQQDFLRGRPRISAGRSAPALTRLYAIGHPHNAAGPRQVSVKRSLGPERQAGRTRSGPEVVTVSERLIQHSRQEKCGEGSARESGHADSGECEFLRKVH